MRRIISMLMIARLVQRLINGGRRGPGMGSWNQGAAPGRRGGPEAGPVNEPPQGGPQPQSEVAPPADSDEGERENERRPPGASD